jgi:hypothetical protein
MQLLVLVPGGDVITVRAEADEVVCELKVRIWLLRGMPAQQQRLSFAGRQLEDDSVLRLYGVQEGSAVRLLFRLRGGLRPRPPSPGVAAARAAAAAAAAAAASVVAAEIVRQSTTAVADGSRPREIDEAVQLATAAATAAANFAQLAQAACDRVEAAVVEAAEAMHDAETEAETARRVESFVARWAAEWRAG